MQVIIIMIEINIHTNWDERKQFLRLCSDEQIDQMRNLIWYKEKTNEECICLLKFRNHVGYEYGYRQGWWKDYDVDRPVLVLEGNNFQSMAHIMVHAGVFDSITNARKNGWNKPVTIGDIEIKKKNMRIRII